MIQNQTNDKKIESFAPIIDDHCRVLILGTTPGEESLRQQQYYAHPRNLFWTLLCHAFNTEPLIEYEQKIHFLHMNHIALWDAYKSCSREGSLDSNIRSETLNDVAALLEENPNIRYVFFNGDTAKKAFDRNILPGLSKQVYTLRLPSTSPANASIPFNEKQQQWEKIRYAVEGNVVHRAMLHTEIGEFTVYADTENVVEVVLPGGVSHSLDGFVVFPENPIAEQGKRQIHEYLQGQRRIFDIPLAQKGTRFQQVVYQALLQVPYGKTISYGDLAILAGSPGAARAVGQAMRKNFFPILIPCHRVIGARGKNVGFMGIRENPLQQVLLQLEQKNGAFELE